MPSSAQGAPAPRPRPSGRVVGSVCVGVCGVVCRGSQPLPFYPLTGAWGAYFVSSGLVVDYFAPLRGLEFYLAVVVAIRLWLFGF